MGRRGAHCSCKHLKAGRRGGQASGEAGATRESLQHGKCGLSISGYALSRTQSGQQVLGNVGLARLPGRCRSRDMGEKHPFIIANMPQRVTDPSISLNPWYPSSKRPMSSPSSGLTLQWRSNLRPRYLHSPAKWRSMLAEHSAAPSSAKKGPENTGAKRAP